VVAFGEGRGRRDLRAMAVEWSGNAGDAGAAAAAARPARVPAGEGNRSEMREEMELDGWAWAHFAVAVQCKNNELHLLQIRG
jgi:hypothetical protein